MRVAPSLCSQLSGQTKFWEGRRSQIYICWGGPNSHTNTSQCCSNSHTNTLHWNTNNHQKKTFTFYMFFALGLYQVIGNWNHKNRHSASKISRNGRILSIRWVSNHFLQSVSLLTVAEFFLIQLNLNLGCVVLTILRFWQSLFRNIFVKSWKGLC